MTQKKDIKLTSDDIKWIKKHKQNTDRLKKTFAMYKLDWQDTKSK